MAYISYTKLSESEFHHNVPARDKLQDINLNQFELKVNDSFKRDEKITTSFQKSNPEHKKNKIYLGEKLSRIEGLISYTEKICRF